MLNEYPVAALCGNQTSVTNNIATFCGTCNLHYGSFGTHGQRRGEYRVLVSRPEGKGPRGS